MVKRKICVLGAFAAGKTSLVRRFVTSIFSEKYLSTVGVKIDKKTLRVADSDVDLLIWDVQGEDPARETPMAYLRGASAYLLVADGTRCETVSVAKSIHERARAELGEVPFVLLLNKADLSTEWEIDGAVIEELASDYGSVFRTSAKTGEGVEEAFTMLAGALTQKRGIS